MHKIRWVQSVVGLILGALIGGLGEHAVRVLASEPLPGKLAVAPTALGIAIGASVGVLIGLTTGPQGLCGTIPNLLFGGLVGLAVGTIIGALLYPFIVASLTTPMAGDATEAYRVNAHLGMRIAIPAFTAIGCAFAVLLTLRRRRSN